MSTLSECVYLAFGSWLLSCCSCKFKNAGKLRRPFMHCWTKNFWMSKKMRSVHKCVARSLSQVGNEFLAASQRHWLPTTLQRCVCFHVATFAKCSVVSLLFLTGFLTLPEHRHCLSSHFSVCIDSRWRRHESAADVGPQAQANCTEPSSANCKYM